MIYHRICSLAGWMESEQFKSGDPFALQCSNLGVKLASLSPLYISHIISKIDIKFPSISNAIVPYTAAPHTVALFSQVSSLMYKYGPEEDAEMWKDREKTALSWLLQHANTKYHGYTWGIPFPWVMGDGVLAPENTPLSTVAPYGSDAFYLAGRPNIGSTIADFIIKDLNVTYEDTEKMCVSYSPLDNFHINNVNAYCAAQLFRAYHYTKNEKYADVGRKLVNYILSEQNEDGSWYYWSSHQPIFKSIDSLHQNYIIQGLYRSYMVSGDDRIPKAVDKCVEYTLNTMGVSNIRKFPKQNHPLELIDSAEMISTIDMVEDETLSSIILKSTLETFSIRNKPYFASRKEPDTNIPFMRWGESQMLFAMAQRYARENGATNEDIYL